MSVRIRRRIRVIVTNIKFLGYSEGGSRACSYLEEGILAQDKTQWEKTLTSKSGPDFDLLDLADDLRRLRPNFELSIPARDAARDQIRKAAKDKTAPSEEARVRFSKLLQLLPEGLRHSMIRDIIDDMTGQSDAAQISRIVESIGDELRLEQENDPDRIVRRIFAPIIRSPTVVTAAWMAKVVENRLDFFRDMPAETKEEFGWRLRTAL